MNAGCWTSMSILSCAIAAAVAEVWQVQWTKLCVDVAVAIDIDVSTSVRVRQFSTRANIHTHIYWRAHRLYLVIERNSVSTSCIRSILRLPHEYVSDLHPTLCSSGKRYRLLTRKILRHSRKLVGVSSATLLSTACKSSMKQELCAKCVILTPSQKEKKWEKEKLFPFSLQLISVTNWILDR